MDIAQSADALFKWPRQKLQAGVDFETGTGQRPGGPVVAGVEGAIDAARGEKLGAIGLAANPVQLVVPVEAEVAADEIHQAVELLCTGRNRVKTCFAVCVSGWCRTWADFNH